MRVRQRLVRDVVVDYGASLARAGFRFILVANGHGGPGHLVALEEASAIVSRRHGVTMASLSGHLAWEFLRGRYLGQDRGRARPRAHRRGAPGLRGGRPRRLVGDLDHAAPQAASRRRRVSATCRRRATRRRQRLVPNYPLRNGGEGYVGHPALADPAFARAGAQVLLTEAMDMVNGLLDGRLRPAQRRSPFFADPVPADQLLAGARLRAPPPLAAAGWWLWR